MFYAGKAEHLPIAIIDQDQSELSRNIGKYLSLNHTVDVKQLLQAQVKPRDYSMKPKYGVMFYSGWCRKRFVKAQDAQISIAFNQSF